MRLNVYSLFIVTYLLLYNLFILLQTSSTRCSLKGLTFNLTDCNVLMRYIYTTTDMYEVVNKSTIDLETIFFSWFLKLSKTPCVLKKKKNVQDALLLF